jgi:D-3-phosphoglycerate dehydrogenase
VKIVVLADYEDAVRRLDCFTKLDGHDVEIVTDGARPAPDTEALVLIRERTQVTPELLDALPRLRLISQTSRVGGHVDLAACSARGVAVAEGVGSPVATAELTWALILAARRHVPQYADALRSGAWQQSGLPELGRALRGTTLGIWGYGKIGRIVAGYGKVFGMEVLVWGSEASRAQTRQDGYRPATGRETFFAEADVLSLHLRLTPETRGIVSLDDLQRMRPSALFVNTARAELVQAGALVEALEAGRPGTAAVDVFETEPAGEHPLLRLRNAVCTPHLGYVERESYELYFGSAFQNVVDFEAGKLDRRVEPVG